MTEREKENLLQEVLGGEETEALQAATLKAGLGALRWRRRKRVGAYLAVMVLPWVAVLYPRQSPPPVAMVFAPRRQPGVPRINEEQLLALFPNRPVALIGKPGEQRLIFLDQRAAAVASSE